MRRADRVGNACRVLRLFVAFVSALVVAPRARAGSAGDGGTDWLDWARGAGAMTCASGAEFASQVAAQLGEAPAVAAERTQRRVSVRIERAPLPRWSAELRLIAKDGTITGHRKIERNDVSCAPLVEALSLVTALLLSELPSETTVPPSPDTTSRPVVAPTPTPTPIPAGAAVATRWGGSVEGGVATSAGLLPGLAAAGQLRLTVAPPEEKSNDKPKEKAMKDAGNSTRAPTRLSAAALRGSALGQGLELARSRGPTDLQLRDLERSVLASLTAAGAISLATAATAQAARTAATASPAPWFAAGATKVALGLTLATLAVGGAVAWHPSAKAPGERPAARAITPAARPAPPPAAAAPSEAEAIAPTAPAAPSEAEAIAPAAPAALEIAAARRTTTRPRKVVAAPALVATDGEYELHLLARANRAVADDPGLALDLANQHAREFPRGSMDQEREVIAVTALVRLGRLAEARQRAVRFSLEHAGSAHLERMRALRAQPEPQR